MVYKAKAMVKEQIRSIYTIAADGTENACCAQRKLGISGFARSAGGL